MLYVKRRANNLFFSKRWPKHLQAVIGSVGFSYPLGSVTQTEAEVSDKVTAALREYAVKVSWRAIVILKTISKMKSILWLKLILGD